MILFRAPKDLSGRVYEYRHDRSCCPLQVLVPSKPTCPRKEQWKRDSPRTSTRTQVCENFETPVWSELTSKRNQILRTSQANPRTHCLKLKNYCLFQRSVQLSGKLCFFQGLGTCCTSGAVSLRTCLLSIQKNRATHPRRSASLPPSGGILRLHQGNCR